MTDQGTALYSLKLLTLVPIAILGIVYDGPLRMYQSQHGTARPMKISRKDTPSKVDRPKLSPPSRREEIKIRPVRANNICVFASVRDTNTIAKALQCERFCRSHNLERYVRY